MAKLEAFRDSLAELVFCDPACGAGNFLLTVYKELRKIETDLIVAIRQRRGETGMSLNIEWEQKLSIGQFYGFELNWWPAKIAETAMFLVDHQANKELANAVGRPPQRLPITITAHIVHGNALALDWAEVLPVAAGVFLYRLSTSRVEKSGADSLCGVVWTGLFSGMTASRLGFYPVG
nr:DNA methyltransferase [Corynebacterium diphtheriae]